MQLAFEFRDAGPETVRIEPGPDDLERWLPVAGWPGYEVSDWGRVQSYRVKNKWYRSLRLTPRLLKPMLKTSGHLGVELRNENLSKEWKVHTLVLEAFVGPRPEGMQACHNDGNPANNRLSNLRWDTQSSNQVDRVKHGNSNLAKLTASMIPDIWRRIVLGESCASIARDYGVKLGCISLIRTGRHWTHITRTLPGWPLPNRARDVKHPPVFVPEELARADEEIWLPVPDWPAYRVSNRGGVMTCWKHRGYGGGCVLSDKWRLKAPAMQNGYLGIQLNNGPGNKITITIHKLVLIVFAGPKPHPRMVACHNDGDPLNNWACNLRWDTYSANMADRLRHGKARSIPT